MFTVLQKQCKFKTKISYKTNSFEFIFNIFYQHICFKMCKTIKHNSYQINYLF